jgi:hypothetical protein
MAFNKPTDIIFNTLSSEIKKCIIKHIPINKLVLLDTISVNPFVDEYIKTYIDTQLFSNASVFTYLSKTKLYRSIINDKIRELATQSARDFIEHIKIFDEKYKNSNPVVDRKLTHLCFNIKYFHGISEQEHYLYLQKPKQKPIVSGLRYYSKTLSLVRNQGIRDMKMNEEFIINEIVTCFFHFMDNYEYIYAVHSIEIVEETYTEENELNNLGANIEIIKKYY